MVNEASKTKESPESPARDRILAAARTLFGQYGFSGTRLDAVAQEACCTKGLVLHYFGSKKGLWSAVLAYYLGMGERSRFLAGGAIPDATTLDEFLLRTFRFFQTHPDFNALTHRAISENKAEVPDGFMALIQRAQGAFALAQKQGLLNPQVDAATGHLMTLLLISGWFSFRDVFAQSRGMPKATEVDDRRYFEAMKQLLESGLLSSPPQPHSEQQLLIDTGDDRS